ncbi:MAG: hypothetical protein AAF849_18500 [Bacteroidota bacterium]
MKNSKRWIWLLFIGATIFSACSTSIEKQVEAPIVSAIYPSSDTLPENLLRMYVHFSKSMKPIGNLEQIKLTDENGQEVVGAIFNNVYELWDSEQRQLTLIFDPARVKTGLMVNEEKGRSLQVDRNYKLVIGQLEDVEGNKLKEVYTKSFYVTEEDRLPPNTMLWEMKIPKANSHSPLTMKFPAMLDRLSLRQRLKLTDEHNRPVGGKVEITKQETAWRFIPTKKWSVGSYVLYVHGRLEDPCGNNLNGLFDHEIGSLKNKQEGAIERILITITQDNI